jgi:hypothetical protein
MNTASTTILLLALSGISSAQTLSLVELALQDQLTQDKPQDKHQDKPDEMPKKPKKQKFMRYGVTGFSYLPTNSRTRDAFGSSWGFIFPTGVLPLPFISPIATAADEKKGSRFDIGSQTMFNRSDSDNKIFLLTIDLEYKIRFDDQFELIGDELKLKKFVPYAGLSISPIYSDISAKSFGVQSKQLGLGASVFAGATLSNRWEVSARYIYAPAIQGFNLNGFNISISTHF